MTHVFSSLCVILIFSLFTVNFGFNVDTSHPLTYSDDSGGGAYFGFSVALHENNIGKYLLAGAPRANSSFDRSTSPSVEPGAVYKCKVTDPPGRCQEIQFLRNHDNSNTEEYRFTDLWDHGWLGGSLDVAPVQHSPTVAACAHLWKNKRYINHTLTNGMCFTIDSELMNGNIKRLMPMTRHSKQTLDKWTYTYSYGLAGMASHFVKDTSDLAIGAPGVLNWTGTVAHVQESEFRRPIQNQIISVPFPLRNADDSYIGYSVSSGSFFNDGHKVQLATGAPRYSMTGAVFIIDVPLPQDTHFTNVVRKELVGNQMGEYFGASVCAVDLNNDKYSDLLVGAPFHSIGVDEGAVYVFMNTKDETVFSLKITLFGSESGARFGSAISSIGDINQDGYQDVAIGAPYESIGGAVHIYHGSKQGPKLTQTILASVLDSSLRGFGMSISRGLDIDDNHVPDFAVGSYASGHATVLRTYPVIKLTSSLEFSVSQINLHAANCTIRSMTTTCFTLRACTSFYGDRAPRSVVLTQTLTIGSKHHTEPRGFLIVGGDPAKKAKYNINVNLDEPACKEYEVHILNSTKDYLTPVSFELNSEMARRPNTLSDIKFCSNCPLINPDDDSSILEQLSFVTNCGEDDVCDSEIKVTAEISGTKGTTFIVGSSRDAPAVLKVDVSNIGEPAYLTTLTVFLPPDVAFTRKLSICKEDVAADGLAKMICEVANPLQENEHVSLEFPLDLSGVLTSERELSFAFNVTTISIDKDIENNFVVVNVPVQAEADISIVPSTDTEQVILPLERQVANSTVNSTYLYHSFQIMKYGYSPINSVVVFINIPSQFNDAIEPYLEITSIEYVHSGPAKHFGGCKNITSATLSSDDINNVDMSANTYQTSSRAFEDKTLVLDCASSQCITVVCKLGPFIDKEVTVIKIAMKVFSSPLELLLGSVDEIALISLGKVIITDTNIQQPLNGRPDIAEAITKFFKYGIPAPKEVANWIIPVCIAVGLLILLIIVLILIKTGFFRRTEKEEMDKFAKQNEQNENLLEEKEAKFEEPETTT